MKRFILLAAIAACHSQPRPAPRALSAEERVSASLERWGTALARRDRAALSTAEDRGGQIAIVYVATKYAASKVDGGSEAVEQTMFSIMLTVIVDTLWPAADGSHSSWTAVVPTKPFGPVLAAAGLVTPGAEPGFAYVPVPWEPTIGRLEDAHRKHREKLFEREAWTCRLGSIETTILPTEPALVYAAQVSSHIFGGWLHDVDAIWLVRADCASGPALFAVTGKKDGKDAILLAKLL